MKLYHSLVDILFQQETSLLVFVGKLLCRNSFVFYISVLCDFFLQWFSGLWNVVITTHNFPLCTALFWFLNYILTLVLLFRHVTIFYRQIFFYILVIFILFPFSSIYLFFLSFLPLWIVPCLMKILP